MKKRKKTGMEGESGNRLASARRASDGTADPRTAPRWSADSSENVAEDAQMQRIVTTWTNARAAAGFGPHRRATALRDFTAAATTLVRQDRSVNWLMAVATWMGTEQPSWVGLGGATKASTPVLRPSSASWAACCSPRTPSTT
ncbi:hypothetical protein [Kitasatospora sp. NPDC087314]|uniref:hypothetical protein n=1 Tax=Kitasatospora sp. NPDC087314 TaxID=3364068 RepID=UPI003810E5D9